MNIVEKNGQPSMEEILASIRRIIADEPHGASPIIDLRGVARPQNFIAGHDDQNDFELPAIFRPQPAVEKPAPLFGRLTDALRNASGSAVAEFKHLRNGADGASEPYSSPVAPASADEWQPERGAEIPDPALSSLAAARHEHVHNEPAPLPHVTAAAAGLEPAPSAPVAAAGPSGWRPHATPAQTSASEGEVKRVMVPFRDTRMVMMGSHAPATPDAPRPAIIAHEVPPAAAPAVAEAAAVPVFTAPTLDFSQIIPGQDEAVAVEHVAEVQPAMAYAAPMQFVPVPAAALPPVVETPVVVTPLVHAPPRSEPARHDPHSQPVDSIENATADLLRPMLRQWLAENMPRMVEKALYIEVAESVKGQRKGSE